MGGNNKEYEEVPMAQEGRTLNTRLDATYTGAPLGRPQAGVITYPDGDGNEQVRQIYTRKRVTPQGAPVTDLYGYDIKITPDPSKLGTYQADTTRFYAPRVGADNVAVGTVIPAGDPRIKAFDDSVAARKSILKLDDIHFHGNRPMTTSEQNAAKQAIRTVSSKQNGGSLEEGIQNIRNLFK
jgi:hypothetical protein